ncbi:MAG: condensation domain-containing protein [Verrucomicrobia bacterium]|nr:condensation domain-containing protein [Verrucomicrobiota bacterium]
MHPLSKDWRGLYFPFIVNPREQGKIIARAYILEGKLNRRILKQAINYVVNLHERLRTCVTKINGEYFEEIKPHLAVDLPFIDLSKHREKKAATKANEIYIKEGLKPMNFRVPPLLRTKLIKLSKNRYYFIFTAHHAAIDGPSLKILLDQLSNTYQELVRGKQPSSKPSRISFLQYEESFNTWFTKEKEERMCAFWKRQVRHSQVFHLPFEKTRYPRNFDTSRIRDYLLKPTWANRVNGFCETHGISRFVFFLTLASLLISRYTGWLLAQNASAANIRSNFLESDIVGNLGSQLFVYQKLKKTDSFIGLAEVLSDKIYQLLENKLYPVNLLIPLFPPSKDKNFEIMRQLSIVHAPDTRDSIDFPDVVTTPISRSTTPTLFRLVLNLREPKHGLIYSVHYPPNIYVKHGIDRMVYNLQQFTRIVIENPRIRLNQLPDLRDRKAASKPLKQSERNQAIMNLIEI